jgi:hypothetical protein
MQTYLNPEIDEFEADEYIMGEGEVGSNWSAESPFSEAEEMALAAELLEISDEAELDQFLGKLFKKVTGGLRKVGRFLRPLGGALKGLAKKALPFVGGALGSFIPIPGVGTAVGSALGGALSKALEAEFAGLNDEDQEFEVARRFVRVAGSAAQQVAQAQPGADPQTTVRNALTSAAQQHVPGLTLPGQSTSTSGKGQRGRWMRQGRTIVLYGV